MKTERGLLAAGLVVLTILCDFTAYSQPMYQALERGANFCNWQKIIQTTDDIEVDILNMLYTTDECH
jgi:hypothetical protein